MNEQQLIQRFGLTYFALKTGIQSGNLSQADALAMSDLMAGLFRDYVLLNTQKQAEAAALETEKLIDKVKAK